MPASIAKRVSRIILWAGSAFLALWALFSPAVGPLMDHHFTERQHSHAHIYFRPLDVDHIHPYQEHHGHRQIRWANNNNNKGVGDGLPGPDVPVDVIYLAPLDGMGQDTPAPLTPATQTLNILPDRGDTTIFPAWPQRDDPLQEAHVAPPKRPPRA